MKLRYSLLSVFCAFSIGTLAHADPAPQHSADFNANYETLTKDQNASPAVAECIASAYDFVKQSKEFDRLGFTAGDISAAKTINKTASFSKSDPRKISKVIEVSGEARPKKASTKWKSIKLRCGLKSGKLKAIELKSS
ncbi:type IV secretion system effector BspC [Falsochrobactrum ovis]|uniref:Uncharacterized protein n=1 Tax=Falsochrobactrum ovis TaxID=1293442 RepID=A0A364JUR1_9HYPH|nr:hypothetical protein [Falsochrobactrum ovis]RAK28498.1 hypothetical protein C7374_10631 [Falsochrobactrum ovis]